MEFKCYHYNGVNHVKLDLGNLTFPERESIEPYLIAYVPTFELLTSDGTNPNTWNVVFKASNWMLGQFTDQQKIVFAKAYALMMKLALDNLHQEIPRYDEEQLMYKIGQIYGVCINELGIIPLLSQYSREQITMEDMSMVGSRPQDSKELTFTEPELRDLIVVSLLSKLIVSISGTIIEKLPGIVSETGRIRKATDREERCALLMENILKQHFNDLIEKLKHYIMHTVKYCARVDSAAAIFSGLTKTTRTNKIFAKILMRNFINLELSVRDSNIMRFCDSMVRTHVDGQESACNKHQVKERTPFGLFANVGEEGNYSQFELDSVVSTRTADIPLIIETEVPNVIRKYALEYDISKKELDACFSYFDKNPFRPTKFNMMLACCFFGRDLGGGRSLEYLTMPVLTKLMSVLQLVVLANGIPHSVAHMITANPSMLSRLQPTQADDQMRLNYGTSFSYQNIRQRFDDSIIPTNGKEWERSVANLAEHFYSTIYHYNTPPVVWDMLEESDRNGQPIENDINIIGGFCSFIEKKGFEQ